MAEMKAATIAMAVVLAALIAVALWRGGGVPPARRRPGPAAKPLLPGVRRLPPRRRYGEEDEGRRR